MKGHQTKGRGLHPLEEGSDRRRQIKILRDNVL